MAFREVPKYRSFNLTTEDAPLAQLEDELQELREERDLVRVGQHGALGAEQHREQREPAVVVLQHLDFFAMVVGLVQFYFFPSCSKL